MITQIHTGADAHKHTHPIKQQGSAHMDFHLWITLARAHKHSNPQTHTLLYSILHRASQTATSPLIMQRELTGCLTDKSELSERSLILGLHFQPLKAITEKSLPEQTRINPCSCSSVAAGRFLAPNRTLKCSARAPKSSICEDGGWQLAAYLEASYKKCFPVFVCGLASRISPCLTQRMLGDGD